MDISRGKPMVVPLVAGSKIDEALSNLKDATSNVEATSSNLITRLDSVLKPPPATEPEAKDCIDSQCSLERAVNDVIARLHYINRSQVETTDRLQL